MARHKVLEQILQLDPQKDHQRIAYLITCYEFPFDTTRSLEFALFRTYAVPSIGRLLASTGEFTQRTQKRYDDTDLILSELSEHGYDSERRRLALKRMNHLHGRHNIANEDFLYVLSTFIYEPIRWNARFGWRPLVEQEKLGLFYFWREVGRRMNIKSIPMDFAEFERYNVEYERIHFRYSDEGRKVAEATRDLFLGWLLPRWLYPLGRPAIYALLDDALIEAFGFPEPSPMMRRLVAGSLKLRARIFGLMPERRRPKLRTNMRHRNYPQGYQIERLGPPV